MKHIYTLICIIILSSCSLDIPLKEAISGDDAINSTEIANEVVNGAYRLFPKSNLDLSILAEDFAPSYLIVNNVSINKAYSWDHMSISILSSQLWNSYYSSINSVNKVLESEKYILQEASFDNNKWNIIKGRAIALKAHAYYELLNLFSGRFGEDNRGFIPKNNVKEEQNTPLSYDESIAEIEKLLDQALQLLSEQDKSIISKVYHNIYSIKTLQAKTALLKQDYNRAITIGEELLSEISLDNNTSKDNYKNLWNNTTSGQVNELLFALDNDTKPFDVINYNEKAGDYLYIPSHFLFSTDDIRHNVAFFEFKMKSNNGNTGVIRHLMGKYRENILDKSDKILVQMRVAEIYFIIAESHLRNNSLNSSVQMLNRFLNIRNATLISDAVSYQELEKYIQLEKQKEFIGEGSNYFDLKRWNKDIKRYKTDNEFQHYTIHKNDYRWNFPIPTVELRENTNATQNPGWGALIIN